MGLHVDGNEILNVIAWPRDPLEADEADVKVLVILWWQQADALGAAVHGKDTANVPVQQYLLARAAAAHDQNGSLRDKVT